MHHNLVADFRLDNSDTCFSLVFRLVHCLIGTLHKRLLLLTTDSLSDSHGEACFSKFECLKLLLDSVCRYKGLIFIRVRQYYHKLITTIPVTAVNITSYTYFYYLTKRFQDLITHLMPFCIVKILKVIDIEKNEGEFPVGIAFET